MNDNPSDERFRIRLNLPTLSASKRIECIFYFMTLVLSLRLLFFAPSSPVRMRVRYERRHRWPRRSNRWRRSHRRRRLVCAATREMHVLTGRSLFGRIVSERITCVFLLYICFYQLDAISIWTSRVFPLIFAVAEAVAVALLSLMMMSMRLFRIAVKQEAAKYGALRRRRRQ